MVGPESAWARDALATHLSAWMRMMAAEMERNARNLRRHADKGVQAGLDAHNAEIDAAVRAQLLPNKDTPDK